LAGVLLVLLGIVGLFLPVLQGALFIVLGLGLIEHPVKHRLHRWLAARLRSYRAIAIRYLRFKRRLRLRRRQHQHARRMKKPAPVDHSVHDLIRDRWSPRALSPEPLPIATILSLFEAARWAASSYNEQPWRFLVAPRQDAIEFERLLGCLVPGNQAWAKDAGLLAVAVARLDLERNGKPNRHALHDVGAAIAHLVLQATAMGLASHAMAGFDVARVRETYAVPAGYEPLTALAIGKPGNPEALPPELRERERAPRTRRPLAELLFKGRFGEPAQL
jgi:nitroreductase